MTWALKRQILYVTAVILFFTALTFLLVRHATSKPPTCTDNRQNGTETGVDCGGICARACIAALDPISVIWSRAFRVIPGRYNAAAYLENHNQGAAVKKINYRFRFADANNIYIGKREGTTFIPPSGKFVVFAPAIDVGNSVPVYVNFEFTEVPTWIQVPQEKMDQLKISVSSVTLTDQTTSPRLSAVVRNNSLFVIPEVTIVALLYDKTGNVVSTSSTYLDTLDPEETTPIDFTWPEPINSAIIVKEIIPMFNVFLVKLK